ncbi:hypothetical protein MJO28_006245 [Puccinia striiformis f. sp. tritici]|uniref:Uncharacterized protein n=3 Tax=Puccinia striiformis TaxID=27350 RepID=A0A2S4UQ11_9BASI|nr:hypothetical protein Pst134EA_011445 [Puccinia striiformis f. sp. tritici]KAI9605037.1 hypothetical protein H4Q26_003008 [Puccinia striiformis f. sp. tritici PST-130]KNE99945.1 hypothetical protein PSTG_06798 [Puccinia striiformis f. sp. tritici PST-78]POV97213.1 hypothetical protein PSTT_15182 [Puccinia striiformis]KAH9456218.1 hypothetical protein Pst134EB_012421 [Puccinia striiformis f. sp. tritici]KAH9467823.1 hypothetical protein Pst134EA_011445 [Puccinia striiformis f. sp. tritici]
MNNTLFMFSLTIILLITSLAANPPPVFVCYTDTDLPNPVCQSTMHQPDGKLQDLTLQPPNQKRFHCDRYFLALCCPIKPSKELSCQQAGYLPPHDF